MWHQHLLLPTSWNRQCVGHNGNSRFEGAVSIKELFHNSGQKRFGCRLQQESRSIMCVCNWRKHRPVQLVRLPALFETLQRERSRGMVSLAASRKRWDRDWLLEVWKLTSTKRPSRSLSSLRAGVTAPELSKPSAICKNELRHCKRKALAWTGALRARLRDQ